MSADLPRHDEPAQRRGPPHGTLALPHLGVIRAHGADAASFLHSQFTQDVQGLTGDRARLAGYCSAKGRLLATFVMLRPAEDELLLVCSADVLATTLKRLSMFVLRARCRLEDASAAWSVFGAAGSTALEALGLPARPTWTVQALVASSVSPPSGAGWAVHWPDATGTARALLLAPTGTAPIAADGAPASSIEVWAAADLRAGLPWITAANVEQFVPQMINLELIDGVNFQKGCYPGQEVVARSQYRGTLKRRMFLFSVDAEAAAGDEVFQSADPAQPAGRVVNAARADGRASLALVEVKLAALASGSLHLRAADGATLRREALPYDVPAAEQDSAAA